MVVAKFWKLGCSILPNWKPWSPPFLQVDYLKVIRNILPALFYLLCEIRIDDHNYWKRCTDWVTPNLPSNMYRMACCQMLSGDDSFIITVAKRCSVRFKYSVFGFSSFYFMNRPLLQLLEASYLPKMMAPHCSVSEISGKHKHF